MPLAFRSIGLIGFAGACAFLAVCAVGCGRSPSERTHPEHDADAHAEEAVYAVTAHADRYEVFYEHRAPVAGIAAGFLLHITDTSTGEPRRSGPVSLLGRSGGGASLDVPLAAPVRSGIYAPSVVFPSAGEWKISIRIGPDEGGTAPVEIPCPTVQVFASREEADHAEAPEAAEGIGFTKEQQWLLGVRIEPVRKGRLVETIRVAGVVAPRPGSYAAVTSPLEGRLLAPPGRTLPVLGERVEAGQLLGCVQPQFSDYVAKSVEAEAEVGRTRLALEQAGQSLTRMKRLAQDKVRSERELQEAEFAEKSARVRWESAVALKEALHRTGSNFVKTGEGDLPVVELRAPIAGIVVEVNAAVGEHVGPEHPVVHLLDPGIVQIEARIPETDLPRISASRAATWVEPGDPTRHVAIPLGTGAMAPFLSPVIDPVSRAAPIVYPVLNEDGRLFVGQSLAVHLETTRVEEGLVLPESAIVMVSGAPVGYVQVSGETFSARTLRLGVRSGSGVEVLEGLAEGERVVTVGAYAVRLASVSPSVAAHSHGH
ncbi:MAG: efflux RND transporter periplasmic adaptor subunit [Planctomycetes bacterium]|nr:efflux RND transporter periplasmic adaptor subunit [Planctomycetota bacterium]